MKIWYDASDNNTAIEQGANKVTYLKSADGSVLRKREYNGSTLTKSYRYLAGGAVMQTCSLADENTCTTSDTYLSLPGGVTLTLAPTNPDTTKRIVYSVKNFHGDTAITANEQGLPTSSVNLYEPFGQSSSSATFGTNSSPANATDQSMGWAANPNRKVAGSFTIPIIQMGARVYIPITGRFLQVDPVEGGTANAYVYPGDPINANDYSGRCAYVIQCTATIGSIQPAGQITQIQPAATISSIQSASTSPIQAGSTRRNRQASIRNYGPVRMPAITVHGIRTSIIPMSPTLRAGTAATPAPKTSGGGYVNISGGFGVLLRFVPVGISGGLKISRDSVHPYISFGIASPGPSASITYSSGEPSLGWSGDFSGFLPRYLVGGSISHDGSWEVGVGVPGVSLGGTYTW